MENETKLKGLMGLSVRARQAVFGEDGCLKTLRGGQCGVLLLDEEIAQAPKNRYMGICEREGVPVQILPAGLLEEATGRPGMAMAVKKGSLSDQISACLGKTDIQQNSR